MTRSMPLLLSVMSILLLAGCSRHDDTGETRAGSALRGSETVDMKGGMADGCSLVTPEDIASAFGGTVSAGVPEAPGNTCHFIINGQTKFGPAKDIKLDVFNAPWMIDRTNAMYDHVPKADIPELGPDAFLVGTGALHFKAENGTEIMIGVDYNLFGGETKQTLAAKDSFVQLGKIAASHIHGK